MQTSKNATSGVLAALSSEYGGLSSLFRGISAPLYTAALVNAIVFGSYGFSSRIYSNYYSEQQQTAYNIDDDDNVTIPTHDPWQKSMTCGSFAGLMQCFVICPMEHVKCRLQTQQEGAKGSANYYKSPFQATGSIIKNHGVHRLYQGWWTTCLREVPAFGLYFVSYDYLKDVANEYIANNMDVVPTAPDSPTNNDHSHTWMASAFAGGCAGCITWALVYPVDVIKTHIQTSPLNTPLRELSMFRVGQSIIQRYGIRYMFRGLGVTLIRAFPVNGTIFPVYEFTLKLVCEYIDNKQ
jgi:solute carrier family 25 carnitine/acylcarnitine transporter 20/29